MQRATLGWMVATVFIPLLGQAQTSEDLASLREELQVLRQEYGERIADLEARL